MNPYYNSYPTTANYGYQQPSQYLNSALYNTQQKLQSLEQQYPQYAQQQLPFNNQQPVNYQQQTQPIVQNQQPLQSIVVASVDEAKIYPVSFDNTLFIFKDSSSQKIYTKQFDIGTGGTIFNEYQRVEQQLEIKETSETQVEAKAEPDNRLTELENTVSDLRQELEELRGVLKDVQSNEYSTDVGTNKARSKPNDTTSNANAETGTNNGRNDKSTNAKQSTASK